MLSARKAGFRRFKKNNRPSPMSRKRALLFFATLTVLILAFTAWATRSLYLHVPVPELLEISPEYRENAKIAVREHGLTRPNKFQLRALQACLLNPFASNPDVHHLQVYTKMNEVFEVSVTRPRPRGAFWPDDEHLIFYRQEDGWRLGVFRRSTMVSSRMLEKK
jgi:hypothetical protein